MPITPQQARQELARRELARRASDQSTSSEPSQPGFLQKTGQSLGSAYTNVVTRPAAATRGFLQALPPGGETPTQGYRRGSVSPETIPSFQSQALDAYYGRQNERPSFATVLGGMVPSTVGMAADILTSPADVLTGALASTKPVQAAGRAIGGTKAGQAVGQFLTKERHLPRVSNPLTQVGDVIEGTRTLYSPTRLANLGKQAEQDIRLTGAGASQAFEAEMKGLPGTVDVSSHVKDLLAKISSNPDLEEAVQLAAQNAAKIGDTSLMEFLTNPAMAAQATPLQVKQAVTTLEQTPSVYRALQVARQASPTAGARFLQRASTSDLDLIQSARHMEGELTTQYPKVYPAITGKYRQTKTAERLFTPRLGEVRSEETIRQGLGSERMFQLGKETFPSGTMKKIEQVRKAKRTIPIAIATSAGEGLRRFLQR